MKILDNKKDYYDYLVGIYGIDNNIIFDRRNSINIDLHSISHFKPFLFAIELAEEKEFSYMYNKQLTLERKNHKEWDYNKGKIVENYYGKYYYFILEIGTTHYNFRSEQYIENGKGNIEITLLDKKENQKKVSDKVLNIIFNNKNKIYNNSIIELPILKNTLITGLISADEIYTNIYNYLSKIKEPIIIDNRNDTEKLESFGFDKITSFRNPIRIKDLK